MLIDILRGNVGLLYFAQAQDAQVAHWTCQCTKFVQGSLPTRNICERFAKDCTYFSNAQYLRKIVLISPMCNISARLYLTSNLKC